MSKGKKGLSPFFLKSRFPDAPVEFSPVGTSFEPAKSSYDIVDVGDTVTFEREPMEGHPNATRVYAKHNGENYPIGWVAEVHLDTIPSPDMWEGVIDTMFDGTYNRDPGCVVLLNIKPDTEEEDCLQPPF